MGLAIMIACVASFRQLFVASSDEPDSAPSEDSTDKKYLNEHSTSSFKSSILSHRWGSGSAKYKSPTASQERGESQDSIVPLEFVTVHTDVETPAKVKHSTARYE
jgi:hypothetical protein